MTVWRVLIAIMLLAGSAPAAWSASVQVWAVEAFREGHEEKQLDSGAREVRDALEDLPFDRFRIVKRERITVQKGQETAISLKGGFTLFLRGLGNEDNGRVRVAARVELAPKNEEEDLKQVVQTTLVLSRQGKARIGGLRMERGELVLVLHLQ